MLKQTKCEYLQNIVLELNKINSSNYNFIVEYRGWGGWWMRSNEFHGFTNNLDYKGEYLGQTWQQAETTIRKLLG